MSTEPVSHLVVIGASAGGIEALTSLVATLPTDLAAPIVIAQHMAPSRPSHLGEILAHHSTLPVKIAADQEPLQPGVVYVVPADYDVEIVGQAVRMTKGDGHAGPIPSVDRLFSTASEAFGENLIAVILSGTGSDGADGARRVKEAGGTVVIQNPQTASHPEMPLSLAPTTVDIVAELPAIGPLLQQLVAGTYAPTRPEDDRRLRALLDQVRSRSGIDFAGYKEPTIRRRLQRRMLDTGSATLEDYTHFLRRHPEEYQRLVNSFLIKVTDFFRDSDLFDHLRDHVLPELIEDGRRRGNELRVWSAGCATGEEAYSLAILVADLLRDDLESFTVRIFATDLDADAVAFGRRGIYPLSAVRDLPAELLERYFSPLDGAFEVKRRIRTMVVFGQHDLGQRAPFPRIDLALCRNVLIYFTPELQRRALQLFEFALRNGGYLVLGKAESTTPLAEHFALVQPRLKIYRRQGERVLLPPGRMREVTSLPAAQPASRPGLLGLERELARAHVRRDGLRTTNGRAEQVLQDLPVGVIVVDHQYDIQVINAAARRLLGIHSPAVGEDVVHRVYRALSTPIRDAIDAAFSGETVSGIREVTSLPDSPGETRFFELEACPHVPTAEHPETDNLVLVTVADVTERERARREQDASARQALSEAERLRSLLQESTATVRQLIRANEELATSNAALRSANEELLIGNEEAQAAMEEIETLNEEQQASNEELETLNEELQATVEELNTTNDDLQGRGVELQDLTHSLEAERSRLAAVLASMADGVLVMSPTGATVLTNDAFQRMFGASLPPLSDEQGQPLASEASPVSRAARGEAFRMQFWAQGEPPRHFEASGQPIRAEGVEGGVVVIRDISDRKGRPSPAE